MGQALPTFVPLLDALASDDSILTMVSSSLAAVWAVSEAPTNRELRPDPLFAQLDSVPAAEPIASRSDPRIKRRCCDIRKISRFRYA